MGKILQLFFTGVQVLIGHCFIYHNAESVLVYLVDLEKGTVLCLEKNVGRERIC